MVSAVPPEAYGSALSISNVTVIAPPATEQDCCRLAKIGIAVVPLGTRSRNVGVVSANDVCPSTASLASASDAMKTRPSCASARSQSATNSAPSRVPLAPRYPPAARRATLPAPCCLLSSEKRLLARHRAREKHPARSHPRQEALQDDVVDVRRAHQAGRRATCLH